MVSRSNHDDVYIPFVKESKIEKLMEAGFFETESDFGLAPSFLE
jgi:hypothetical protein